MVLLHGHREGGDAAGNVIEAFGNVVGGNYAVGLVVFLISDDHQLHGCNQRAVVSRKCAHVSRWMPYLVNKWQSMPI